MLLAKYTQIGNLSSIVLGNARYMLELRQMHTG